MAKIRQDRNLNRFIPGETMPQAAAPTAVSFEHRTDHGPVLGIGVAEPRLSWVIPEAAAGFEQVAYEIELARPGAAPDAFVVESREQVLVPWPGAPLVSRESVHV